MRTSEWKSHKVLNFLVLHLFIVASFWGWSRKSVQICRTLGILMLKCEGGANTLILRKLF